MNTVSSTFDASELELIRASLAHVIATEEPASAPGALLAGGWADLVAADRATAITLLAEEAGRARSAVPVMDVAMLDALAIDGIDATAVITGGHTLDGAARALRFVVIDDGGVALVDRSAVAVGRAGGFDPALGLSIADADHPGERIGGTAEAIAAIAAGRRALASQMAAAAGQMLVDTLAYVTGRHQYGRAIGSFQSVKHRLVDVQVAVAAARAGVAAAWESSGHDEGETLAIAAKCLAGRAQRLASTHCFQVHGGIAFTVEHGFQQWVRRGLVLDVLLGSTDDLGRELGRRLLDAGRAPRHPALRGGELPAPSARPPSP